MDITQYITPELLVLAPVLYLVAEAGKRAGIIADKHIPLALGALGIVLATLWVLATTPITGYQDGLTAAFTATVQGILCAGLAVYGHQIGKQVHKDE